MRGGRAILALIALGGVSCLNFRPAVQAPGPEVEALLVCRSVVPDGDLFAPRDAGQRFGPEVESVYAFVKLGNVGRDTWLRWRWYTPEGKLGRDSGRVAVATGGRTLEAVTAFDRLDFAPEAAARPAGAWTVVLFIEEDLAGRRSFSVAN